MLTGLALLIAMPAIVGADTVLSTNLSATSAGTETASGSTWLTSSFGTGTSASILSSVTLLLDQSAAGLAEVDIYSNGGLQPGSLVGILSTPTSYSSSLADVTFPTSGIALDANSTYWVVLHAISGSFDWSWTADDTGTGIGFQDTWGQSYDAGTSWFAYDSSPTQMSVVTTDVSSVPEPGSMAMVGLGLAASIAYVRRRRTAP